MNTSTLEEPDPYPSMRPISLPPPRDAASDWSSSRQALNTALAIVLSLGTLLYFAILLAAFHRVGQVALDNGLTAVYALVLTLYAADNEACKNTPICATKRQRPGQWFVVLWVVVAFYIYAATSLHPNSFTAPDYFLLILGQVVTLFGLTSNREFITSWVKRWVAGSR